MVRCREPVIATVSRGNSRDLSAQFLFDVTRGCYALTRCEMHDGAVIDVYGTVTVVLVATHV